MLRLIVSAGFVGSNLAASFIVVIVIARFASETDRAAFFAFQPVFFIMMALASQAVILQGYRGQRNQMAERITEAVLVLAAGVALFLLIGDSTGAAGVVAYAASGIVSARGASTMATLQFEMTDRRLGLVPIFSATCRIAVAWLFIGPLGLAPAFAFFAAASVHLALGLAARAWHRADAKAAPVRRTDGGHGQMLLFIAGTALAFQWDRLMLSGLNADSLVVTAGVISGWVLPPLSLLFATVYRANAREIFSVEHARSDAVQMFGRYVLLFVPAAVVWLAVLWLVWTPLNALAFPFFKGEASLAMLLGASILVDRVGNLAAYICGRRFGQLAVARLLIIACAAGATLIFAAVPTLGMIFTAYLIQSCLWALFAMAVLFGKHQG